MSRPQGLFILLILIELTLAAPDPVEDGLDDLKHFVLTVPNGLQRAKSLSEDYDLNLLGEVIPGTNLFHFSMKDHHLKKRSTVENIHERLTDHPHVVKVHKQKVLSRSRRHPMNEFETELQSSVEDGEKICLTKTKPTSRLPAQTCVFPFSYRGKTYTTCTIDHSDNKEPWCATEVDDDGVVIKTRWADCAEQTCDTPSNADNNQPQVKEVSPLNFSPLNENEFPPDETDPQLLEITSELINHFNDKAWPYMWHLNRGGRGSKGLDMNVDEAWAEDVTGEGVVVSIVDDGIERTHPDLKRNYDAKGSYDFNENDEDPMPRYDDNNSNKHGTRCAGVVAAAANNSFCGVGVAFNSKIGGLKILDGNIYDANEARALSYNRDHIDIYCATWGPEDDGQTIDGPGYLASVALKDGATNGRRGKGSIFVWAATSVGGSFNDNCNCDGYATSIYTLSISSVGETGQRPWYTEACSSILATTYNSGRKKSSDRQIITSDLHGLCTEKHSGTSGSAAMAAGIIALCLEANPQLTWRDIQHLVIRTARPRGHLKAPDWLTNGAGLQYSHVYGFGLMDAGKMVKLAKKWFTVPKQVNCTTTDYVPSEEASTISSKNIGIFKLNANIDYNGCAEKINHLEHVQLHFDLTTDSSRGDISLILRSPAGTESILLDERPLDRNQTSFSLLKKWPLMSLHFWGESISNIKDNGDMWTLLISNNGDGLATLNDWSLTFFGTYEDPQPGMPIS